MKLKPTKYSVIIFFMGSLILSACQNRAELRGWEKNKKYGEIGIYSHPPRAMIIVDNYKLVKTPAIVAGMEMGRPYHFKIMREGYQPWEETIMLRETRENLHIQLKP